VLIGYDGRSDDPHEDPATSIANGKRRCRLCERVFFDTCIKRGIPTEEHREELASSIIHAYQHGVRDEETLRRLFI